VFLSGQGRDGSSCGCLALVGPEGSGKGTLLAAAAQRFMRNTDPVLHGKPMQMLSRLPSMRSFRGGDAFRSMNLTAQSFAEEPTPARLATGKASRSSIKGTSSNHPPTILEDPKSAIKPEPVLVMRFIGLTRFSSAPADLLYSIIQQLAGVYGPPPSAVDPIVDPAQGMPSIPESYQALVDAFPLWLSLPSRRRPLVLVLVGLHRLRDQQDFSWIPLNPPPVFAPPQTACALAFRGTAIRFPCVVMALFASSA
jgi:hypothetical protein